MQQEPFDGGRGRCLIVGLGNAGKRYRETRHNVGFMLVDDLALVHGIRMSKVRNKAIIGEGTIHSVPVVLAKPQTMMNLSGDAVAPLARYFRVPLQNLLVAYDELDLPLGTIRLRPGGGAGGHNGMKSIIKHLGQSFPRLRLGIGRPPGRMPPAAYVLQRFAADEEAIRDQMLDAGCVAVESWLEEGIDLAMSRHNRRLDEIDSIDEEDESNRTS